MLRKRIEAWASRRAMGFNQVSLGHSNLFILPSKTGLAWLFLFILIWIGAANYDNNPARFLSWWLLAVFFVTMFRTQQGLLDSKVKVITVSDAMVGDMANVKLRLIGFKSEVSIGFKDSVLVDVPANVTEVTLEHRVSRRGVYMLSPISVVSYQPLGLFRCWSILRFRLPAIGFPRRIETKYPPLARLKGNTEASDDTVPLIQSGSDYFESRPYIEGEPMNRVDWRAWAKTNTLFSKHYGTPVNSNWVLSAMQINGDIERTLSVLSYWVHQAQTNDIPVGLELYELSISLSSTQAHYVGLMRTLALYGEYIDD